MGLALAHEIQLETHECGECGIVFAAPATFWSERRRTGKGWTCPNGHSRIFTETDVQKLQKQLDAEKQRVEAYKRQLEFENRQHIATKGLLTKARKKIARVENGVCPECNRSFQNLRRHMETKHSHS